MQHADIVRHAVVACTCACVCALLAACGTPSQDSDAGLDDDAGLAEAAGVAHAATGIVQSVDRDNHTAVIHHDPVVSIGMPEMTMTFRLADPALADQLGVGDRIAFEFVVDAGVVLTAVHGTPDAPDSR